MFLFVTVTLHTIDLFVSVLYFCFLGHPAFHNKCQIPLNVQNISPPPLTLYLAWVEIE